MPLAPAVEFHHDPTWPVGGAVVIMTANKVWGPLATALLTLLRMALYV
jgi:hypothetical protein